ncbi:MAG: hypothetical protein HDS02_07320 [Bacteroides sp.]|nr:hypothetical protein [Bacteroides sp.]
MATAKIQEIELTPDYFNEGGELSWDKNGFALFAHLYPGEDADVPYINITRSVLKCFNCYCLTPQIAEIIATQLRDTEVEYHFDEEAMEYVNSHDLHMTISFSQEATRTNKQERNQGEGAFSMFPPERPKKVSRQRNSHRSSVWPLVTPNNPVNSTYPVSRKSSMRNLFTRLHSLLEDTETI